MFIVVVVVVVFFVQLVIFYYTVYHTCLQRVSESECIFWKTVTVINYGKWFGKYYIWYVFFCSFFLFIFLRIFSEGVPLPLCTSMMCVLFCCCRFNNMNDYIRIQNLFLIEIKFFFLFPSVALTGARKKSLFFKLNFLFFPMLVCIFFILVCYWEHVNVCKWNQKLKYSTLQTPCFNENFVGKFIMRFVVTLITYKFTVFLFNTHNHTNRHLY